MNSRSLQAIIFDMDGVITDTMKYHYLANKKIATELGIEFNEKDNEEFKGISRIDVIKGLVSKSERNFNQKELEELSVKKNKIYQEFLKQLNKEDILEGILPFIQEAKKKGLKLAVASSSTNAKNILERLGIFHLFDHVVDARTVKNGKPNPEVFLKAADAINVPYKNCVAIEDGVAGLKAIFETEMFAVGIGEELFLKKANYHIYETVFINLEDIEKEFYKQKNYIIGIDGGGTYIRGALGDYNGKIISFASVKGGINPEKNKNPKKNLIKLIDKLLIENGMTKSNIGSIVCGFAGLNGSEDLIWSKEYTNIEGLYCKKIHVNDGVVALNGAFAGKNGISIIAGTGSMVTGLNEKGEIISNREHKNHDARAGAVKLSIDLTKEILKSNLDVSDENLIKKVLEHHKVKNLKQMEVILKEAEDIKPAELLEHFGKMAPIVTKSAKEGSLIAKKVCENAMKNLAKGVHLVAEEFVSKKIYFTITGGIIKDEYMFKLFVDFLNQNHKKFKVTKPKMEPEKGAIYLGWKSN